jgi:hypothetical protein
MASFKLFWNPDSPPCRLVWSLLHLAGARFSSEIVAWSVLKDLEELSQVGSKTGQVPWMETSSGSIDDSLSCVHFLLSRPGSWFGSPDFHLFRLAEIHAGHLLHFCYWQAQGLQPLLAHTGVSATTSSGAVINHIGSELLRIRGLFLQITRACAGRSSLSGEAAHPGLLSLAIQLDFIEALSGQVDPVLDASVADLFRMVPWTRGSFARDLRHELAVVGAQIDGFSSDRWAASAAAG